MASYIQSVISEQIKSSENLSRPAARFVVAMLMARGRKNYASMAREHEVEYADIYQLSNDKTLIEKSQQAVYSLIKKRSLNQVSEVVKKGILSTDFTLIRKIYSEKIKGTTHDYDSCGKEVRKGISSGFLAWMDDEITIPFDYDRWYRKADVTPDVYRSKVDITINLIKQASEKGVPFSTVLLDGAFATKTMIKYLIEANLQFSMRIPRNRIFTTSDGIRKQLKEHPAFRMVRNQHYVTVKGFCLGFELFITAQKRKAKNDTTEIVFIISNIDLCPKQHVDLYARRWNIEMFFRTSKQYLGLADCQSTKLDKQDIHIRLAILAYAALQTVKCDKQKNSVEEILHTLRFQKSSPEFTKYIDQINAFCSI